MANWFQRFIEQLAKANSEAFQGKKLDCCDLNKQNKNQVKKKTDTKIKKTQ